MFSFRQEKMRKASKPRRYQNKTKVKKYVVYIVSIYPCARWISTYLYLTIILIMIKQHINNLWFEWNIVRRIYDAERTCLFGIKRKFIRLRWEIIYKNLIRWKFSLSFTNFPLVWNVRDKGGFHNSPSCYRMFAGSSL